MDVKWASDICLTQIYLNPGPPPPASYPMLSFSGGRTGQLRSERGCHVPVLCAAY